MSVEPLDDIYRRVEKPTCFIGIDPGASGAIVALIEGAATPVIFDMPVVHIKTGTKGHPTIKSHLDGQKLRRILHKLQEESGEIYAVVETTAMRPAIRPAPPLFNNRPHSCSICHSDHMTVNQGMASQGSFMKGGGIIVGILIGLGIAHEEVPSNVWTAEVFHGRTEKLDHRKLAQQMYPRAAGMLERVKDDGRADALLLADYIKRRRNAPF